MQYSPEQKNSRTVNAIIALSLLFGAAAYAIPVVCEAKGVKYMPWLFSLLTLFSVVTALYFLVRYKMTGFVYALRPRSEIESDPSLETAYAANFNIGRMPADWVDFVVMKSQGSRMPVTECVLSVGDLVEIIPVSQKGKGGLTPSDVAKKYRERAASDFAFYDYTLSYRWESATELVFIDGQKYVGIIIEADEALVELLRSLKK